MPYTGKEHESQGILTLDDFTGGMNRAVLPSLAEGNECYTMENMFLDARSGRPRTRYPIIKYSASAIAYPVNGLFKWGDSTSAMMFLSGDVTSSQILYYLNTSTLVPASLGTLTGTSRPVFAPFHGKLIIASGGLIQQETSYSSPVALVNVPTGVSAQAIFERYTRLVATGDPAYPDRVYESAFENETDWTSSDYGDVGLQDGLSVVGIAEAFDGLYIVFKRGRCGLRTYYMSTLSATTLSANLAADGHAAMAHAGVVHCMGKIFVMEKNIVSSLVGTDKQGSILYDPSPGIKLPSSFTATEDGFAVVYPKDYQIWFVPNPAVSEVYVYHYMRNAWSLFTFGNRKIYSAWYDPVADYLYLGCDDGFVYYYNHAATSFVDTAGAYTQTLTTKTFCAESRESEVKSPSVMWECVASGSGKFYVYLDYASSSPQDWGTLTVTGTSGRQSQRLDYNTVADAFQYSIVMTSGAYILDRIVTDIGEGRRMRW
jgi:hypothetical protein